MREFKIEAVRLVADRGVAVAQGAVSVYAPRRPETGAAMISGVSLPIDGGFTAC